MKKLTKLNTMKNGLRMVVLIQHLVNARFEVFLNKFRLPITQNEYSVVFDAAPSSILQLIGGLTVSKTEPLSNFFYSSEGINVCMNA